MDSRNNEQSVDVSELDESASKIGMGGKTNPEIDDNKYRHEMEARKEIQSKRLQQRRQKKGLIIVFSGNGKGKTTAALGMALRTIGHGERVAIIQFIKGGWTPGEAKALKSFGQNVAWHALGEGFTWETQDRARDQQMVSKAWEKSLNYLQNNEYKLVILDEINIAIKLGYIETKDILNGIKSRPKYSHVVLTGRYAPQELIDNADLVTEMTLVRHPFREQGVKAQAGIEF